MAEHIDDQEACPPPSIYRSPKKNSDPTEPTDAEIYHDRQCSRYAVLATMIASKAVDGDKRAFKLLCRMDRMADELGLSLPAVRK